MRKKTIESIEDTVPQIQLAILSPHIELDQLCAVSSESKIFTYRNAFLFESPPAQEKDYERAHAVIKNGVQRYKDDIAAGTIREPVPTDNSFLIDMLTYEIGNFMISTRPVMPRDSSGELRELNSQLLKTFTETLAKSSVLNVNDERLKKHQELMSTFNIIKRMGKKPRDWFVFGGFGWHSTDMESPDMMIKEGAKRKFFEKYLLFQLEWILLLFFFDKKGIRPSPPVYPLLTHIFAAATNKKVEIGNIDSKLGCLSLSKKYNRTLHRQSIFDDTIVWNVFRYFHILNKIPREDRNCDIGISIFENQLVEAVASHRKLFDWYVELAESISRCPPIYYSKNGS